MPAPHTESMPHKQNLSALLDGQLDDASVQHVCREWATSESLKDDWRAYQLIGDVMRSAELAAHGRRPDFLQRFQERLAQEPVILAPAAAALVQQRRDAEATLPQAAHVDLSRRKAVAMLAAGVVLGWTIWSVSESWVGSDTTERMASTPYTTAVTPWRRTASAGVGFVLTDAPDANAGCARAEPVLTRLRASDEMVRDPQLDRLLDLTSGLQTRREAEFVRTSY